MLSDFSISKTGLIFDNRPFNNYVGPSLVYDKGKWIPFEGSVAILTESIPISEEEALKIINSLEIFREDVE